MLCDCMIRMLVNMHFHEIAPEDAGATSQRQCDRKRTNGEQHHPCQRSANRQLVRVWL